MSISKKLSSKLYDFIAQQHEIDQPEVILYGIESFCASVMKAIILLTVAFIFGLFLEVVVCMLSFGLLRQFSGGAHMPKSLFCLFSMVIIYGTAISISQFVSISPVCMTTMSIFSLGCILRFAPADTRKHPIVGPKHRKSLRLKSLITFLIGIAAAVWFKGEIAELIVLSFLIQSLLLSPIAYRITLTERRIEPC